MGGGSSSIKNPGSSSSKSISSSLFVLWKRIISPYFSDAKKFNQCYMLARELGSGAFSVVKLGVNLVGFVISHLWYC
jgi:hypothetical protein